MCQALVSIEMMMIVIEKNKKQARALSSWNLSKCTQESSPMKKQVTCCEGKGALRWKELCDSLRR